MTPNPETIWELISRRRDRDPAASALAFPNQAPLDSAGLAEQTYAVGTALARSGVGRGDRVALVLPPGAANAACLLGVASFATAVPLNGENTADDFARDFARIGVRALIVAKDDDGPAVDVANEMGLTVFTLDAANRPVAGTFGLDPAGAAGDEPQPNQPTDTALVLLTSGTTALPKVIPMTAAELLARATNTMTIFDLGPTDRCLCVMPLYHGHGIYHGLLAALLAGGSTICLGRPDLDTFFALLTDLTPTWYTASFAFQNAVLNAAPRHSDEIAHHHLRFIRSGSGALSQDAQEGLEATFGVPVVVTYALTEAGIVAATPMARDERKAGTVGPPLAGMAMVVDEQGRHLTAGEQGEIVVKGPHVSTFYEGDAEATARADAGNGWFRTGDAGCVDRDGFLSLAGRLKEMINRGGEKIAPAEIDAVLMTHADVAEAVAFALPHPTLGEEVAVAVVARPGATVDPGALRDHAFAHLAPFKVPKKVFVLESIPRGPSGKPLRNRIAEKVDSRAADRPSRSDTAMTEVESLLCRLWEEEIGVEEISPDEDLFLLGGDSIQAARVFARIEEELGRKLPISVLFEAGSVRDIARVIDADTPTGSLVAIRAEGQRPPLYCIHGGTGDVLVFRDLAQRLPQTQPVYALQAHGLSHLETPLFRVGDMARAYLAEIRTVQPRGPYLLCGYSFGGLVAHALAVELDKAGEQVGLLALFDSTTSRTVPARKRRPPWFRDLNGRLSLSPRVLGRRARWRTKRAAHIYSTAWRVFVYRTRYYYYVSRRRPVPNDLRNPRMGTIEARSAYDPESFTGSAILFRASDRKKPEICFTEWPNMVAGGLDTHFVRGDHVTMMSEPEVASLAAALEPYLAAYGADDEAPRADAAQ